MKALLQEKKVLLGVSGGIAIYKAVDLLSKLRKTGAQLKVILTPEAEKMVSGSVFSAVGNCPVYSDLFDVKEGFIPHTDLSRWAELFIIAPATANTMAKLNVGIADNLLLATALAYTDKPKLLVPTMNTRMYENISTVENIKELKSKGWHVLEPEAGQLACGEVGKGRYPDNSLIMEEISYLIAEKSLQGIKALVTAGPTREKIDNVRFITNRSSGKMGYAIARALRYFGAEVTLITGPTTLLAPAGVEIVRVESAAEMANAVDEYLPGSKLVVMTAAVADYRPIDVFPNKLKKHPGEMTITLERTRDILMTMKKKPGQIVIGFCAEDRDIEARAREKLSRKSLDAIVCNDISRNDIAFESDENEVTVYFKDGSVEHLRKAAKDVLALELVTIIARQLLSNS
ncbi:bifunctional phosphopantothenoylcysteine decarboxylase/phosphopantothenate--cysteine ligase CoaBC [Kosmotoga pacifica]|uniref:Coenzyme A biosynthesis bifunctional protein CoaBC n=1 Tax=Kosmotoga pacifica TaxID=1330330 RepID=A0A0G2Z8N5_9BACT|nr:bifunctional phosphopantothenoylcysteine decarboxylase/phosphopantothenate--cysteine ligase CoaBC [Kosmotoga pacifica]AKI97940.1 phosphopantothenoylcysteine decarboxylase [Kosmotoga pacifica]